MPRKKQTKSGLSVGAQRAFDDAVSQMRTLGTYKDEYVPIIRIYAELGDQYRIITERFAASDYEVQIETAQGGAKKSPMVATLECLRKDILAYSDRLCLNPKALDTIGVMKPPQQSKLDQALGGLHGG